MSAPVLPQSPAAPESVSLSLLAACHDAELREGHPTEAHDLDLLDVAFAVPAPGYPTAVAS